MEPLRAGDDDDTSPKAEDDEEDLADLRPKGPKVPFPKLEPPKGEIQHKRGGKYCGGAPKSEQVSKYRKCVDVTFTMTDTPLEFVSKKQLLFNQLSTYCHQESLYTILGVFQLCVKDVTDVFEPLLKKEGHYDSFRAFFNDFQHELFPDLPSQCLEELRKTKQRSKETARAYFIRYRKLVKSCKRQEDVHIFDFIKSLKSENVKQQVRERHYKPGTKTLKAVADHAYTVETAERECREERRKKTPERRPPVPSKPKNISSMSASKLATEQQRRQGARPKAPSKQKPAQREEKPRSLSDVSYRSGDIDQTHPIIASMQSSKAHYRYKDCNESDLARHFNKILAERRMKKCCYGCLGDHQFSLDFNKCGKGCPFCGTWYHSKHGHAALDCWALPSTKDEIEKILKKIKEN